ncbi:Bcr/CflA family efflux MFS transporter [Neotabrizicola sp. VNH66]|uniref:Bcr/CflA family efflux MFS transporter n=1 Tax=Neotabrizicola sp. VNH66 TaxID=3400918 RepID=UPI003C0BF556
MPETKIAEPAGANHGAAGRRPPSIWLPVMLACTGTLPMHMFVPVLPFAATELGVDAAQIQLSIGVYVFTLGIGQLLYGPVSDALGRRPVVIAGVLIFVAGSLVCAMAQSLGVLLAGRVLQAAGGAAGLTMARAVVRDVAGGAGSQRDISLLNLIMLIGPAVSPVLGSWLAVGASWRVIFLTLGLFALLALGLVLVRMAETVPLRQPLGLGRVLGEMGGLATHRRFACTATGGALASTQTYAYFAAAPYILIDQLRVQPAHVGWFVGGILLGAVTGTVASRWRIGRMSQNGFMLTAALLAVGVSALFLMTALWGGLTPGLLFLLTLILMFSGGAISPTALAASLDTVPDRAGAAAGFFGSAQMALGGVCTLLVGLSPDQAVSCGATLLAASVLSLGLLWVGRVR